MPKGERSGWAGFARMATHPDFLSKARARFN